MEGALYIYKTEKLWDNEAIMIRTKIKTENSHLTLLKLLPLQRFDRSDPNTQITQITG